MSGDESVQGSGCAQIVAAVERTCAEGSAEVVVTLEYDVADEVDDTPIPAAMSNRLRGVIDFGADRTRLTGSQQSLVLDGPVSYETTPDGRWIHQTGRPGQWSAGHPRWALEVLRGACRSVEPVGHAELALELDRETVTGLSYPGMSPDWQQLQATTIIDDVGRLRQIDINAAGTERPDARLRIAVEFTSFDQRPTQIDLPASSIEMADYLAQPK